MDIYIVSLGTECNQFEPKQEEPVSVVISPLRVDGTEGNLKITSGCNLWKACENPNCYFSKAARPEKE